MSKWIVDIHGDIEGDYDIVAKIPDNATNGDVIKALFPNRQFVSICSDRIFDFTTNDMINCDLEWWDAPYKENKDGSN